MSPMPLPEDHRLTYGPVVLRLGVFCTLCVLFGAYIAWHLGGLARITPQAIGALGWTLFAYHLLGVNVSFNELSGLKDPLGCTCSLHWLGSLAVKRCRSESPTVK